MYLTSTKFIVLTVAFVTQCVYAKPQNGYAYFDEKFYMLEWIIYLKRLSLIALMLCGIVLYYMPKSRSYARKICYFLIDAIANRLKLALDINETEYKKVKNKNNQYEDLKIQELYRKINDENTGNYRQKYDYKINFGNNKHKSIRKHKNKRYRIKHDSGKYHRHNHHRNMANNALPESETTTLSTIPEQNIAMIDEKCNKNNIIIPQNISSKMKITTYTASAVKFQNNISLQQENPLNKEIKTKMITKNNDQNFLCKSEKLTIPHQQEDISIDTDKKLQNIHNFDCMLCSYQELREVWKENQFLYDIKSFTHECYENTPIIKDRIKPVLFRIINWLFGGCPEASKRHKK